MRQRRVGFLVSRSSSRCFGFINSHGFRSCQTSDVARPIARLQFVTAFVRKMTKTNIKLTVANVLGALNDVTTQKLNKKAKVRISKI